MLTRDSILAGPRRPPVPVEVAGQAGFLRHPTFAEWREIVARHPAPGQAVGAEDAARAVAVLLCDASGARLFPAGDEKLLLDADPSVVAGVYKRAWETVLAIDDDRVEAAKGE